MGGIWEMLKSLFDFGKATAEAVTARTKPVEIQIEEHNEQKKLREQDFDQAMINDDFRYLKSRTELDIKNYLEYLHPGMSNLDKYIEIVTERVHQFRKDHPIIFKKWLKENNL